MKQEELLLNKFLNIRSEASQGDAEQIPEVRKAGAEQVPDKNSVQEAGQEGEAEQVPDRNIQGTVSKSGVDSGGVTMQICQI